MLVVSTSLGTLVAMPKITKDTHLPPDTSRAPDPAHLPGTAQTANHPGLDGREAGPLKRIVSEIFSPPQRNFFARERFILLTLGSISKILKFALYKDALKAVIRSS